MNRSVTQEGLTGHFHSISVGLVGFNYQASLGFVSLLSRKDVIFPR